MKRFVLFFLVSFNLWAAPTIPESVPEKLPKDVQNKVKETGERLLKTDCPFLLQQYHKKDTSKSSLGLCIHTVNEARGVFVAQGCIAGLAEPDSGVVNPFYGSKGHWGMEGPCTTDGMKKKLKDPQIPTTVNPFTAFGLKQKEGYDVRLLRDDLHLWDDVRPLIEAKKK